MVVSPPRDIGHTAGTGESAIHAAMMLESGLATMLGLFCEVNAGVLATTYGSLAVHELTAIWDVAYADDRREVTPTEQHVHGFLERVPLMATAFLAVLHWDQAQSMAAVTALVAAPYGEELVRCVRAHRGREP
jgi:hypothetical protein